MSNPLSLTDEELEFSMMSYDRFQDLVTELAVEAVTQDMVDFVAELLFGADEKVKE